MTDRFRPKKRHALKCRKCKSVFASTGTEDWCWPCFAAWRSSNSDRGQSARAALDALHALGELPGGHEVGQLEPKLDLPDRKVPYTDPFPCPSDPADILTRRRGGRVRIRF